VAASPGGGAGNGPGSGPGVRFPQGPAAYAPACTPPGWPEHVVAGFCSVPSVAAVARWHRQLRASVTSQQEFAAQLFSCVPLAWKAFRGVLRIK